MLTWLISQEEIVKNSVRRSEEEVKSILNDRTHEETVTEHTVSIYDTERNQKAKQYKQDLVNKLFYVHLLINDVFLNQSTKIFLFQFKKSEEERLRKQTLKVDYLAPFLAERGIKEAREIRIEDAVYLKQRCLADLKQRLIDKANLMQSRFNMENKRIQDKQQWYQSNPINMSREDEQEYLDYCAEAMFRIHILEIRLNRHKENAPVVYQEMERRLRDDPRLHMIN